MTVDGSAELLACLDSSDCDGALMALASSPERLARLQAPSVATPVTGVAVIMMANALSRAGRGAQIRALLGEMAELFAPRERRDDSVGNLAVVAQHCPTIWIAGIVAAMAEQDWIGAVAAIHQFETDTRTDSRGGLPAGPDVEELLRHPAIAGYGPFHFDRGWILEQQQAITRAGQLDRRLELVRDFEQLMVENALRIRQPERVLPLVEELGDRYVPVGGSRGGHLEFNAICVLATLGRFDDALRRAHTIVRQGYPLRWRFDLASAAGMAWTQAMGQNEWLGALAETPAYQAFLREDIVQPPFPVDDPSTVALCAVREGVWEGRKPRRCWLSRQPIAPGDAVVRVRRLTVHADDGSFDIAARDAFEASGWAEARRQFATDRIPLAALFPRLQRPTWDTPAISALHHDLVRGAVLDVEYAAALIAGHAPNPIRHRWLKGKYEDAPSPPPLVADGGHGDAVNLTWRLLKVGHAEDLFRYAAGLPQADQVFAMLGTFNRPDCRAAAAAHFAIPELPAMMDIAFSKRPSLDDHLAMAAFGSAHPRWRAGMAAAMRTYALHLYSNYHPGVDWFLEGLERYIGAHGCQLLFFLIHHPQDDPVLSAMIARAWLPDGNRLGGFDAYDNAQSFYFRAAVFNRMLHAPEQLDAWLNSEWMAFYCSHAKDQETRRMVAQWRKKNTKPARRGDAKA